MTTPRRHKHTDIIRQWLDDDSIEIEVFDPSINRWVSVPVPHWQKSREYRIKPRIIKIGEYDVPEPLRVVPKVGTTFYVVNIYGNAFDTVWSNDASDYNRFNQGFAHLTEDAANLHSLALNSFTERK